MFEGFPHGCLSRVSYSFVEVDHLAGELVKLGAFSIGVDECLVTVAGSKDGEVVDVDGGVDEGV